MMAKILVIDDEENIRASLKSALENRGHTVVTADSISQGREYASGPFDLILLDVMLPDGNGVDLLKDIIMRNRDQCVVMISGHADIETAVSAIRLGAYDFIEKPLSLDPILITIENATRTSRLVSASPHSESDLRASCLAWSLRGPECPGISPRPLPGSGTRLNDGWGCTLGLPPRDQEHRSSALPR